MSSDVALLAAIETGGTKVLCRVTTADGRMIADARFPTSTPQAALEDVASCIASAASHGRLAAIGLASFGPLVVDSAAPDWGRMLPTPKPHWTGFNLRAALADRFGVPVAVETDVGAAARAEQASGAGAGLTSVAYLTVGTGIGGGLALSGRTLAGASHPEVGHLRLCRAADDRTPSACPFHADCAEGLASGPAVALRLRAGETLADRPEVRAQIGNYLGQLCAVLTLAWSPQALVLGGGVMGAPGLLEAVAAAMRDQLGGYAPAAAAAGYVRAAALEHAGLEGALLLASGAARGAV
jgi:fructokinase